MYASLRRVLWYTVDLANSCVKVDYPGTFSDLEDLVEDGSMPRSVLKEFLLSGAVRTYFPRSIAFPTY